MNSFTESRDTLLVEMDDGNLSRQQKLTTQALLRNAQGDVEGALCLYREAESLSRQYNDSFVLKIALGNLAVILKSKGDFDGALRLFKEKESICREHKDTKGLAMSLARQGEILALKQSRAADGAVFGGRDRRRLGLKSRNNKRPEK